MNGRRSWLFGTCLGAALALLVTGCASTHFWPVGAAAAAAVLLGWILPRPKLNWLPDALLAIYVVAAAGGVLLGGTPALLVAGVALMLVTWELAAQKLAGQGEEALPTSIRLLAISVGVGLLLAEVGLRVSLRLPFAGVVFAGLLVLVSLYQFFRVFK